MRRGLQNDRPLADDNRLPVKAVADRPGPFDPGEPVSDANPLPVSAAAGAQRPGEPWQDGNELPVSEAATSHLAGEAPSASNRVPVTVVAGGAFDFALPVSASNPLPVYGLSAEQSAAVTSLEVLGPTSLDPDLTHASGIDGNAWVCRAVMPAVALATFDPTKVLVTLKDAGYTAGSVDEKVRVVRGAKRLRRQYPNDGQPMDSTVGGVYTVHFTLEDDVFVGTTVDKVDFLPGFYGSAQDGVLRGVTNGSTFAVSPPLFGWLNLQHERVAGTTLAVEAVAYHRFGMKGRMVDCVEFSASDGHGNTTPVVRCTAPTPSALQTQGQIVEAWKATLDLTTLVQGDVCTVDAVVKPHIGPSWRLSDVAVAWPTSNPQTLLRFKNDKAGTYGGRAAYVRAGATGGAVGSPSTPFPTLNAAVAALVTANGGYHGGSTVYLMDDGAGGAVDHVLTANIAATAGDCWTDVRVDPAATGQVRLKFDVNLRQMPSLLRYRCPVVFAGPGNLYSGNANANLMVAFDGAQLINSASTSGAPHVYAWGLAYYRNVTTTGMHPVLFQYSNVRSMVPLALGVVDLTATNDMQVSNAMVLVGCRFNRATISELNIATVPNSDPQDGRVFANNVLLDARSVSSLCEGSGVDQVRGLALVQNVIERAHVAANPALALGQGGASEALSHRNILLAHNTVPGTGASGSNPSRVNILYSADAPGIGKPRKELWGSFNLFYDWNMKGDVFQGFSTETGRVSNFAARHGVGRRGNVTILGGDAGDTTTGPASWLGDYQEPGSKVSGAAVGFVNNQSGGAAAVGGGDYRLTGATNDAYGRVPAGLACLAYDLDGAPRRNDGTGAAGAYERTT